MFLLVYGVPAFVIAGAPFAAGLFVPTIMTGAALGRAYVHLIPDSLDPQVRSTYVRTNVPTLVVQVGLWRAFKLI